MIDTIQIKRRLQSKGFSGEQAEGLAEEMATQAQERLVTKSDLERLRLELKALIWKAALGQAAAVAALLAVFEFLV